MIVLKIVFWMIAMTAFLALCVYIHLASRGDSDILYSTVDTRLVTRPKSIFLGLAAIGFLVCMYQGANAMLGWLPNSWGSFNDDGDFRTLRSMLSFLFAIFAGLPLIQVIDRSTHRAFFIREFGENAAGLQKIIEASLDSTSLESARALFTKRIAELDAEISRKEGPMRRFNSHLLPEGQRIMRYRQLIALTEMQLERLKHRHFSFPHPS